MAYTLDELRVIIFGDAKTLNDASASAKKNLIELEKQAAKTAKQLDKGFQLPVKKIEAEFKGVANAIINTERIVAQVKTRTTKLVQDEEMKRVVLQERIARANKKFVDSEITTKNFYNARVKALQAKAAAEEKAIEEELAKSKQAIHEKAAIDQQAVGKRSRKQRLAIEALALQEELRLEERFAADKLVRQKQRNNRLLSEEAAYLEKIQRMHMAAEAELANAKRFTPSISRVPIASAKAEYDRVAAAEALARNTKGFESTEAQERSFAAARVSALQLRFKAQKEFADKQLALDVSTAKSEYTIAAESLKAQAALRAEHGEKQLLQKKELDAAILAEEARMQAKLTALNKPTRTHGEGGGLGNGYVVREAGGTMIMAGGGMLVPSLAVGAGAASVQTAFLKSVSNTDLNESQKGIVHKDAVDFMRQGKGIDTPVDQIMDSYMKAANLRRQGQTMAETINIARVAVKAASADFADAKDATDALARSMYQFNIPAKDADRVMNLITAVAAKNNLTLEEFVTNSGRAGATASEFGISLQEVLGVYGTLTKEGYSAAQSGTSVRSMLKSLTKPTKDQQKEIEILSKKYGVDLATAFGLHNVKARGLANTFEFLNKSLKGNKQDMENLFPDARSNVAIMSLMTDRNKDLIDSINAGIKAWKENDRWQKNFADKQKSIGFQLDAVKNKFYAAADALGVTLLPNLTKLLEFVTRLIDKFDRLSPGTKHAILDFTLWAGGISLVSGAILITIGRVVGLVTAIGKIIKAIELWRGGMAAVEAAQAATSASGIALFAKGAGYMGALAIVAYGVSLIVDKWHEAKTAQEDAAQSVQDYQDALNKVGNSGKSGENIKSLEQIADERAQYQEVLDMRNAAAEKLSEKDRADVYAGNDRGRLLTSNESPQRSLGEVLQNSTGDVMMGVGDFLTGKGLTKPDITNWSNNSYEEPEFSKGMGNYDLYQHIQELNKQEKELKSTNTRLSNINKVPAFVANLEKSVGKFHDASVQCGEFLRRGAAAFGFKGSIQSLADKAVAGKIPSVNPMGSDAKGNPMYPEGTVFYFKSKHGQHFVAAHTSSDGVQRVLENTESGAGNKKGIPRRWKVRDDRTLAEVQAQYGQTGHSFMFPGLSGGFINASDLPSYMRAGGGPLDPHPFGDSTTGSKRAAAGTKLKPRGYDLGRIDPMTYGRPVPVVGYNSNAAGITLLKNARLYETWLSTLDAAEAKSIAKAEKTGSTIAIETAKEKATIEKQKLSETAISNASSQRKLTYAAWQAEFMAFKRISGAVKEAASEYNNLHSKIKKLSDEKKTVPAKDIKSLSTLKDAYDVLVKSQTASWSRAVDFRQETKSLDQVINNANRDMLTWQNTLVQIHHRIAAIKQASSMDDIANLRSQGKFDSLNVGDDAALVAHNALMAQYDQRKEAAAKEAGVEWASSENPATLLNILEAIPNKTDATVAAMKQLRDIIAGVTEETKRFNAEQARTLAKEYKGILGDTTKTPGAKADSLEARAAEFSSISTYYTDVANLRHKDTVQSGVEQLKLIETQIKSSSKLAYHNVMDHEAFIQMLHEKSYAVAQSMLGDNVNIAGVSNDEILKLMNDRLKSESEGEKKVTEDQFNLDSAKVMSVANMYAAMGTFKRKWEREENQSRKQLEQQWKSTSQQVVDTISKDIADIITGTRKKGLSIGKMLGDVFKEMISAAIKMSIEHGIKTLADKVWEKLHPKKKNTEKDATGMSDEDKIFDSSKTMATAATQNITAGNTMQQASQNMAAAADKISAAATEIGSAGPRSTSTDGTDTAAEDTINANDAASKDGLVTVQGKAADFNKIWNKYGGPIAATTPCVGQGVGQAFGDYNTFMGAVTNPGSAPLPPDQSAQAKSTESAAMSAAGSGALGAGAAAAVPWVAGALAVASILGAFKAQKPDFITKVGDSRHSAISGSDFSGVINSGYSGVDSVRSLLSQQADMQRQLLSIQNNSGGNTIHAGAIVIKADPNPHETARLVMKEIANTTRVQNSQRGVAGV